MVSFESVSGLAGGMVLQWIVSGYQTIPSVGASLLAFTAIAVGVQAVLGSCFIGIIHDACGRRSRSSDSARRIPTS